VLAEPSRCLRRSASATCRSAEMERGKFYQLGGAEADPKVVTPGLGPFGVIVGGWTDDELEFHVGPTLETAAGAAGIQVKLPVPVRVLAQSDLGRTLKELLPTIEEMDAVLPEEGDEARLRKPLLLFSGWDPESMLQAVRQFRSLVALRQLKREPMAAMVVPRALGKSMWQLVEEIEGDFDANKE